MRTKTWPKTLLALGIIFTIIGSILLTVGIVLASTSFNTSPYNDFNTGSFVAGSILIYLSIFTCLVEGIPMWIVGGIFAHKYKQAAQYK